MTPTISLISIYTVKIFTQVIIVVGKLRVIMAVADDSEGCHQMLYESKSAPLRSGAPNELSQKVLKVN